MTNKLYLTWHDVSILLEQLAIELETYRPEFLLCITRGGLVPATILSYRLKVPLGIIPVPSFDNGLLVTGELEPFQRLRTLIVKDIVYRGTIVANLKAALGSKRDYRLLTLVQRDNRPSADFVGRLLTEDETHQWVVFPWET